MKRLTNFRLPAAIPWTWPTSPDWTEKITFEWKGTQYRYVGDGKVMLMAIPLMPKGRFKSVDHNNLSNADLSHASI